MPDGRMELIDAVIDANGGSTWELTPVVAVDAILANPLAVMEALGAVYNGKSSGDLGLWRFSMTEEQHAEARKQWEF